MTALTKVYYKIIPKDTHTVQQEIIQRTEHFKLIQNNLFIQDLHTQFNNYQSFFYGFLNESTSPDVNKIVIGKDGCYLTKTTQLHNLLFIWHNRTTHQFEFWAKDKFQLIRAIDAIRTRIHNASIKDSTKQTPPSLN